MEEIREKCITCDGDRNYRYDANGWNFVHIEGSPKNRGIAYGKLMAKEIESAVTEAKALVFEQTGMEWEFFRDDERSVVQTWKKYMTETASPFHEFYAELQGMEEGLRRKLPNSKTTCDDLIVWNGLEELTDYWFPTVAQDIYCTIKGQNPSPACTGKNFQNGADDHCSAFIATGSYTKDGRIVMAHNSFSPFESGNYMNVVVDMIPDSGYPFIMQSEPGYVHSMSDFYETCTGEGKGLMITETTIGGFNAYDPDKAPEFLRIRYAVQYADSFASFVEKFWQDNNGGYANTWLVGDIATNEIMRFETGLKFYKIDTTKDGYYAGFNAPLDPRIRNLECSNSGFADIRRHQGARQVRIPQLMEEYKGRLDNESAQAILADHYDIYTKSENPSSRTVCSHYELDPRESMSQPGRPVPFQPRGAMDGVTATSDDAERLAFWARWGSSCGRTFDAAEFLRQNPQFEHLKPFLKDRPSQPWTRFANIKYL